MRAVLTALATCGALASPQIATADVVVIELFTSQGCSSCPPADAILGELANNDDIIALSLHVDYWDYLVWKDDFANPAFTERQKQYAAQARSTMIYTPQMVVGGTDNLVGSRAMQLMSILEKHRSTPNPVAVSASRKGEQVVLDAQTVGKTPSQMVVQLVQYSISETVDIKRGENAGRMMTYHHVVKSWDVLGTWDGKAPLEMTASTQGDAPGVVIIQDGTSGPILAAARID